MPTKPCTCPECIFHRKLDLWKCSECKETKTQSEFSYAKDQKGNHICCKCNVSMRSAKPQDAYYLYTPADSDTAGFAGYNNGLDTVVKNRGHWNELVKEQGLRPVG